MDYMKRKTILLKRKWVMKMLLRRLFKLRVWALKLFIVSQDLDVIYKSVFDELSPQSEQNTGDVDVSSTVAYRPYQYRDQSRWRRNKSVNVCLFLNLFLCDLFIICI